MNETPLTFPYLGGNVYFPIKSLSSFFPRLLHLQQCFEILWHSSWHYQITQIKIYQTHSLLLRSVLSYERTQLPHFIVVFPGRNCEMVTTHSKNPEELCGLATQTLTQSPLSLTVPTNTFWTQLWLLSEIVPAVTRPLDVVEDFFCTGIF